MPASLSRPSVTAPHATAATTSNKVATTSFSVPPAYAASNTAPAPMTSGISGTATARPRSARLSSRTAAIMMTIVNTTKAAFTMNSEAATAAPSRTPIVIAARKSRPALRPGTAGASGSGTCGSGFTSDLEQLDFLVPQDVVDLPDIAMGEVVEFFLGAVHVVLAGLAGLFKFVERFLPVPTDVVDRDLRLLGLVARKFDVVTTPLFGELRNTHPDYVAVVGRIDAEIGIANRFLDRAQRSLVVRVDDDHPGVGDGEAGQLVERSHRSVVLDDDPREHPGMRTARANRRKAVLRDADGFVHLLLSLEESVVNHRNSLRPVGLMGWRSAGAGRHDRADLLTVNSARYVALFEQVEDNDRHGVVAAQADGRRVSELQVAGKHFVVVERVEPHGVRIALGVTVVHPVDTLGHQDHLGADLERALSGGRVGGEVRRPEASAKNDDPALFQVAYRPAWHVGLGDLTHRDRGLHPGLDMLLLQEILKRQAVHHGAEHAHVVRPRAVHAAHRQLGPAKEVATPDDDRDLHTLGDDGTDLPGKGRHDVRINAE